MTSSRFLNLGALGFFLAVIAIVFWQVETDFKEQGIASGGPYDNAASFPRTIAVVVCVLVALQLLVEFLRGKPPIRTKPFEASALGRAGAMLMIFAVYLMVLTTIGYHLATTPMIIAIMWTCGMRNVLRLALASVAIATGFAFVFEVYLNVVLPLGIWGIFIPW